MEMYIALLFLPRQFSRFKALFFFFCHSNGKKQIPLQCLSSDFLFLLILLGYTLSTLDLDLHSFTSIAELPKSTECFSLVSSLLSTVLASKCFTKKKFLENQLTSCPFPTNCSIRYEYWP